MSEVIETTVSTTPVANAAPRLNQYLVTWQIDVEAANPRDAAEEAQRTQRSYRSDVSIFDVWPAGKERQNTTPKRIDLSISKRTSARSILIEASVQHMVRQMKDPEKSMQLLKDGFGGFDGMTDWELVNYAKGNLTLLGDSADEDIGWAIEQLG
jgi:hypothetical protein